MAVINLNITALQFILHFCFMSSVLMIPGIIGADILTTLLHPLGQASHNAFVGRIATGLLSRNHTVTVAVASTHQLKGLKENAYTRIVKFKATTPSSASDELAKQLSQTPNDNAGGKKHTTVNVFASIGDLAFKNCEDMFRDNDFMNDLRRRNFDLLVVEMFVPCDALLAEYLKVPFVVVTGTFRYPVFDEDVFNMAIPSSYVPFQPLGALTNEMNFVERLRNFIDRYVIMKVTQYRSMLPYRKLQLEHGIGKGFSVRQLAGKAELWLCQIDFALEFARPTAPNWIPIGGLMASSESKPLPQDLEDFVQGSGEHGIIIFSLGSMDLKIVTPEQNEFFALVFSELPQRVIWRFNGPPPRNLGSNTRLLTWLPQADLLAHSQTRLLIYHGGMNGVYEAMRNRVPMVLLPLFADQPAIAARVAKKGMGVVLDKDELSVDVIRTAIRQVLDDPSYKSSVNKFGSIHLDTLVSPLDTALFWIDHVIKFGGSHLKSRANELNLLVLNSIDVFVSIISITCFVLYLNYLIFMVLYRRICRNKSAKTKAD